MVCKFPRGTLSGFAETSWNGLLLGETLKVSAKSGETESYWKRAWILCAFAGAETGIESIAESVPEKI